MNGFSLHIEPPSYLITLLVNVKRQMCGPSLIWISTIRRRRFQNISADDKSRLFLCFPFLGINIFGTMVYFSYYQILGLSFSVNKFNVSLFTLSNIHL